MKRNRKHSKQSRPDPWKVLGITYDASDDEVRQAYLALVREFPPDREPVEFAKIREAYDLLKDSVGRCKLRMDFLDPNQAVTSLLSSTERQYRYVGPGPWMAAIKGK